MTTKNKPRTMVATADFYLGNDYLVRAGERVTIERRVCGATTNLFVTPEGHRFGYNRREAEIARMPLAAEVK